MQDIQRLTFKALVDWLEEIKSTKRHIMVQASQVKLGAMVAEVSPATGLICLSINPRAISELQLHDDCIKFTCGYKQLPVHLKIPYTAILLVAGDAYRTNHYPYFEDHGSDYMEFQNEPDDGPHLNTSGSGWEQKFDRLPPGVVDGTMYHGTPGKSTVPTIGDLTKFFDDSLEPKRIGKDTLVEKMSDRRWTVIEGGRTSVKPEGSSPFIDEIHRARRERREKERLLAKINLSGESGQIDSDIRLDGSKGTSAFFPNLDPSKCVFPGRRVKRPAWVKVINGGKA